MAMYTVVNKAVLNAPVVANKPFLGTNIATLGSLKGDQAYWEKGIG